MPRRRDLRVPIVATPKSASGAVALSIRAKCLPVLNRGPRARGCGPGPPRLPRRRTVLDPRKGAFLPPQRAARVIIRHQVQSAFWSGRRTLTPDSMHASNQPRRLRSVKAHSAPPPRNTSAFRRTFTAKSAPPPPFTRETYTRPEAPLPTSLNTSNHPVQKAAATSPA